VSLIGGIGFLSQVSGYLLFCLILIHWFNYSDFKGPCKSGEWLILGPKSNPVCAKRTCPENTDPNPKKTWFTLGGTCHQLTTQAFCDKATERVHFNKGSIEPKCSETPPTDPPGCGTTRTLIAGAPSLPCGPGQKKTGSGACGTAVAFA
jgi:hypothetical protein